MCVNVFEEKMKRILISTLFLLTFSFAVSGNLEYSTHSGPLSDEIFSIESYKHDRQARDVSGKDSTSQAAVTAAIPATVTNTTTAASSKPPANNSSAVNNTTSEISKSATPLSTLEGNHSQLVGVNGSGILHVTVPGNKPKVSDPILPNDDINSEVFKETPEIIKAEQNLTSLTYDDHDFYKSSFIGNLTYFQEYWGNITKPVASVHEVLSNSHRRATSIKLNFDFPFYGHDIRNITVATGGFVYTGDVVHNWLAATQYISPLMANFDTTLTNDSLIKMYDDGNKFTVFWENATLQEMPTKKFTFAVTLYKNGDIVFAYKDIPIPVTSIVDDEHPVKVGISDAYLKDKILFYVRRKTIYEYHRVNLKNHDITNNTILKLTALPTCLQYDSCKTCVNHETGFDCMWCELIRKCSSGTDRNKQDWELRNCDAHNISKEASCPAIAPLDVPYNNGNTAYTTDTKGHPNTDTVTTIDPEEMKGSGVRMNPVSAPVVTAASPLGGVVAAFASVALVCCLGAWLVYAFKNPHTRSGQLLIKYRPSQWGWRRGEARYTAATIHM